MRLSSDLRGAIVEHLAASLPNEGCGLFAVDAMGTVCHVYPVVNVDQSPFRFTVEPGGHFAAISHAESNGWEIGGAFHSHPQSAPEPSRTDIAGALDPLWLHLIVGLGGEVPELRAWRIVEGKAYEQAVTEGSATACR